MLAELILQAVIFTLLHILLEVIATLVKLVNFFFLL
jgi:hypothetical protein